MSFPLKQCDFNGHIDVMQYKMRQHFMNNKTISEQNIENNLKNRKQNECKYSDNESDEDEQFDREMLKNNLALKIPSRKRHAENEKIEFPNK